MKKFMIWLGSLLLLIILLAFIFYKELTLLHFINISFYFASMFIFFSLFTMVVQNGFFDGITYSFRRVFRKKDSFLDEEEEYIPFSKLFTYSFSFSFKIGFSLLAIMMVALFLYYL